MSLLDNVFDVIELEKSVEENVRNLGLDPLEVCLIKEDLEKIAAALNTITEILDDKQKKIFKLMAEGNNITQISRKLDMPISTVEYQCKVIPKKFLNYADDNTLLKLKKELEVAKSNKSKAKLMLQYEHHYAVREALKFLFSALTPRPSMREIGKITPLGKFTFEQRMKVCTGIRFAHTKDYNGYVPVTKCMIPEYFDECGIRGTVCPLCNKCKRK